ncbi:hypothetical protein PaecuDRAFT_4474 [Paenibacillus curdlanolyticus YK9]|uniref:Uncharacterized protein n=1 Tax=Paenibacillus curdlanolyticus YK9 TaxID=717606 RepID=E0IFL4_9BACL|nr:hypothetical protein PaecuDRAFT_4474 [Paenibacillus curdlanolyticus YK9]
MLFRTARRLSSATIVLGEQENELNKSFNKEGAYSYSGALADGIGKVYLP